MRDHLEYRYADLEVRQGDNGETIATGTVIRYGDVAELLWFTEEFRAGWCKNADDLMYANRMHNRDQPLANTLDGLTIKDDSDRMTSEVVLPDTNAGRDAAVELDKKLLRGMSLEFLVTKDEYDYKKDHRVVVEGRMFGFGIVDRPAYPDSVAQVKRAQEYRQHYGLWTPEKPEAAPVVDPEPEPVAVRYHFVV